MRTMKVFLLSVLTLGVAASLELFRAAEEAKPKYDIEEIMEKAHKPPKTSLFAKVKSGKANDAQKKELLELYQELAKNPAPKSEKGSPADWKKRTTAIVKAAKDVVDDKPDATKDLAKAAACAGCHQIYKSDD